MKIFLCVLLMFFMVSGANAYERSAEKDKELIRIAVEALKTIDSSFVDGTYDQDVQIAQYGEIIQITFGRRTDSNL